MIPNTNSVKNPNKFIYFTESNMQRLRKCYTLKYICMMFDLLEYYLDQNLQFYSGCRNNDTYNFYC